MDLSVLWCLGPDFDKQSVFNLLNDSNDHESAWPRPSTPNWLLASPSQWNHSGNQEAPIYTPRSVVSELGPQSPTMSSSKRPLSDVSNRISSRKTTDLTIFFYFLCIYPSESIVYG